MLVSTLTNIRTIVAELAGGSSLSVVKPTVFLRDMGRTSRGMNEVLRGVLAALRRAHAQSSMKLLGRYLRHRRPGRSQRAAGGRAARRCTRCNEPWLRRASYSPRGAVVALGANRPAHRPTPGWSFAGLWSRSAESLHRMHADEPRLCIEETRRGLATCGRYSAVAPLCRPTRSAPALHRAGLE